MCYGMHCPFERSYIGTCKRPGYLHSCPDKIYSLLEEKRERWLYSQIEILSHNGYIDPEEREDFFIEDIEEQFGLQCPFPNPELLDAEELSSLTEKQLNHIQ